MKKLIALLFVVFLFAGCSKPTANPTNTLPVSELKDEFETATEHFLLSVKEIQTINLVKADNGILKIDVVITWASEIEQPVFSYRLLITLSKILLEKKISETALSQLTGGDGNFAIEITSYSSNKNYKYHSITDYETLQKIYNSKITFDKWIIASSAGFK